MPSHCFLCRLKGKRCVQLPNHLLCTACQHLRVECMSCLIKVPNAVRVSFRNCSLRPRLWLPATLAVL
ncbi:uncharacterized protein EI90DRAFT_3091419, partial [Cantharellus anzutake]|uniref:uncharacterized protein n=1 Tax=Cantharellus anzutake TaxID=1750568 RepID=UPI0019047DDB